MPAIKRHPLVRVDLQSTFDWYEDKRPGLGREFQEDFRAAYRRVAENPTRYAIRLASVRRVNLQRFPYGIFYVVKPEEIRILAVLHDSRDTRPILSERRRTFFSS